MRCRRITDGPREGFGPLRVGKELVHAVGQNEAADSRRLESRPGHHAGIVNAYCAGGTGNSIEPRRLGNTHVIAACRIVDEAETGYPAVETREAQCLSV